MQPSSTIRSDSVELVTARLPFAVNQRPGAWPLPVQTPEREGEPSAQSTHEPPPMRLAFSKSLARSPSAPQPGQGGHFCETRLNMLIAVRLKGQNTKILEAVGDTSPIAVRGESTRRKFLPVKRNNSAQRLFRKASRQGSGRQRESATIEEDKDDENSGDERSVSRERVRNDAPGDAHRRGASAVGWCVCGGLEPFTNNSDHSLRFVGRQVEERGTLHNDPLGHLPHDRRHRALL
eukprot:1038429-Rhodomonas_salina.1